MIMKANSHQNDEDEILKRVYCSDLYDFYGPLIKDNQREVYELYILEDYGISEIARNLGKSRQAVYEIIRRVDKQLMNYEEKLKLFERFKAQQDIIQATLDELKERLKDQDAGAFANIEKRLNDLLE